MQIKHPLKDRSIIKTIRNCAEDTANIIVTNRARQDMVKLRMTKKGVCQAICDWIDNNKEIIQDISKQEVAFLYEMYPEIDGIKRYVKVQLLDKSKQNYKMLLVSAHEYTEK